MESLSGIAEATGYEVRQAHKAALLLTCLGHELELPNKRCAQPIRALLDAGVQVTLAHLGQRFAAAAGALPEDLSPVSPALHGGAYPPTVSPAAAAETSGH